MSEGDEHAARVGASMRQRVGGWLPTDQGALERWLAGLRSSVEEQTEPADLHPVMVEFQELIGTDPVVRMYFSQMIAQVPASKPYRNRHLHSVEQLVRMINEVLTMAPEFGDRSMVATPLAAILD